jgi:hypothetical protein
MTLLITSRSREKCIRPPPGPPRVNSSSRQAVGCVWAVRPGQSVEAPIGGGTGTLMASGTWFGHDSEQEGVQSTSSNDGGAYWPWPAGCTSLTKAFSLAGWYYRVSAGDWGMLFSVPRSNSGWSNPWAVIAWGKNGSSNSSRLTLSNAPTWVTAATDFWQDGLHHYAITRTVGGLMTCYRDGLVVESSTENDADLDWAGGTSAQTFVLMNRSNYSTGEGVVGTVTDFRLYDYCLSGGDVEGLYDAKTRWELWGQPAPVAYSFDGFLGGGVAARMLTGVGS